MKAAEIKGVTEQEIKDAQRVFGTNPDGDFGPGSVRAAIHWLRDKLYLAPTPVQQYSGKRAKVVEVAQSQLGERDPHKYYEDCAPMYMGTKPNDKSWCGVFALWCLRQVGLTDKMWVDGKGFASGYLPITNSPEPGDIAYFARNSHYAIVKGVTNGRVYLINGNAMLAPKEGVVANDRAFTEVTVFYSIRNLV